MTFSASLSSQKQQKNVCTGEKYNQFDFWEGSWKVYDVKGKLIGTNNIVKLQDNCVLQENWTSKTSKNTGTSYNYYSKVDNAWHQVWVDNSGFSLVLKGNLINDNMVLESDIISSKKGKYSNRITWSRNNDGTVTQVWETLNLKGIVISEAFRGIYKRVK